MDLDFTGKTAVVTGAARGIGRSIAAGLFERGATVVLADVLPEVADTAAALGDRASGFVLDVTDAAAVKEFLARHWPPPSPSRSSIW